MKESLKPGASAEHRHRVVSENLVSHHNPKGAPVLATPYLLMFMEYASWLAMDPHLDEGEDSVGVGFDFQHLAPTPAGATLVAKAVVTAVDERMVTLEIEAHDGHEVVSKGTHVRAVIELERFRKRLSRKIEGR
jgi:fluoroacetyl-CoA thioesterase